MEHSVAHNAPAESDAEDDLLARNIWLAGLGVYSMSLQEAQSLDGKAESMFEKLVDLGRDVEQKTRQQVDDTLASSVAVEQRVQNLFTRLSGVDPAQLTSLDDKLAALTERVEKLAAARK
ncbi:MAG: phasin family protein [Plesiomonas shigelloides]